MREWDKVSNIFTIEDVAKLLEWKGKLRRGSLTAVQASKEVFIVPN